MGSIRMSADLSSDLQAANKRSRQMTEEIVFIAWWGIDYFKVSDGTGLSAIAEIKFGFRFCSDDPSADSLNAALRSLLLH